MLIFLHMHDLLKLPPLSFFVSMFLAIFTSQQYYFYYQNILLSILVSSFCFHFSCIKIYSYNYLFQI